MLINVVKTHFRFGHCLNLTFNCTQLLEFFGKFDMIWGDFVAVDQNYFAKLWFFFQVGTSKVPVRKYQINLLFLYCCFFKILSLSS